MPTSPPFIRRLRMVVAYDGGPFRGWQSQQNGQGVQDFLERAILKVRGPAAENDTAPLRVHGAGRTDSGVHALGQVAHVDLHSARYLDWQWREAINANLPPQIRVMQCRRAPDTFHARFSAVGKTYLYRIWNDYALLPLHHGRAWHLHKPIDVNHLRANAQQLVGTHNFRPFAANRGWVEKNTVRTITSVTVRKQDRLITLAFTGDGFLYRQVRLMVGALRRSLHERAGPDPIARLLADPAGAKTQFAAPADGLYLAKVRYSRSGNKKLAPDDGDADDPDE